MGFLSFLFGSTAHVEVDQEAGQACKVYNDQWSFKRRQRERDLLEELGCSLQGTVRVPALLTTGYTPEGEVEYNVTEYCEGMTLSELSHSNAEEALYLARQALSELGYCLPDLETEGNIKVVLSDTGQIQRVWIIDVGDIV